MKLASMMKVAVAAVAFCALGLAFGGCAGPHTGGGRIDRGVYAPSGHGSSGMGAAEAGSRSARPAIPGAMPSREEELWVIERPGQAQAPRATPDDVPGTGALMARVPGVARPVPVPLKHTEVKASITGYIATTEVTQQYQNPFDTKIEALYVFPLPHNAAVSDFVMTVGTRRIRGVIRDREEARQIYAQARAQGYVASLLTQERPNVFTQAVANIEPGKQIDINVRFFNTLAYADGWYEYVFPMVVGPRFNAPAVAAPADGGAGVNANGDPQASGAAATAPGAAGAGSGIGAVERGAGGVSGQGVEVQYLRPTERSGHDVSVAVRVNAGVAIEKVESRNHQIAVTRPSREVAEVTIADADKIPNRDFVLRFKVAGGATKSAMLAQRDERGSYFTLMLYPPEQLEALPRKPLELVFVVDVSGSQAGAPLEQSKAAVRHALARMNAQDTFQVIRFSSEVDRLAPAPLPATPENVRRGLAYADGLAAHGGTMLVDGLRAALDYPPDESRLRFVVFLTDGFIGDEAQSLAVTHRLLGQSRIFMFGVGSSTNRYLMEHMARMGNGAVAYLGLNDKAEEVMDLFFKRIAHPALTDIALDFGGGGGEVAEVFPARVPDLFIGRPVVVTGRFKGEAPASVRVRGKVGNEATTLDVAVTAEQLDGRRGGIAPVWARMKIAELADRATWEGNADLPAQVKQVALAYGLLSEYTAFVAVDASAKTAGDFGVSVPVPVRVPDGVRYDTTVQQKSPPGGGQ